jgi:beta-phosphoglucomutase-like phosphatase (HAD superfamily)
MTAACAVALPATAFQALLKGCCLSIDCRLLQGAVAAGMRVVVMPSLVESHDEFKAAFSVDCRLLQGAVAAGMRVVVVPSLVESHDEFKALSQEEADGKGGTRLAALLLRI